MQSVGVDEMIGDVVTEAAAAGVALKAQQVAFDEMGFAAQYSAYRPGGFARRNRYVVHCVIVLAQAEPACADATGSIFTRNGDRSVNFSDRICMTVLR